MGLPPMAIIPICEATGPTGPLKPPQTSSETHHLFFGDVASNWLHARQSTGATVCAAEEPVNNTGSLALIGQKARSQLSVSAEPSRLAAAANVHNRPDARPQGVITALRPASAMTTSTQRHSLVTSAGNWA
ncbi:hypothetical protein EYF80_006819 [Liparis tanakae]|uniref:Uncharacterized protein n=1 Tax=Liparis tanakae TaxID=230148 RepID=A0A4Z2IZZ2_9TELE|nr:hypothetical protein EYF80_006819 [Liparis tanakae]